MNIYLISSMVILYMLAGNMCLLLIMQDAADTLSVKKLKTSKLLSTPVVGVLCIVILWPIYGVWCMTTVICIMWYRWRHRKKINNII